MPKIEPPYQYRAKVSRVIDGDTIVALVDLGFKTWVERILRLARINAPELPTPEGIAAKEFAHQYLLVENDGEIFFTSKKLDPYGRSIAEVQAIGKTEPPNLSDLLVSSGNAVYRKY
jgi:micrococcal nuclease